MASGWRPHLESALCLNLSSLFADQSVRPGQTTSGTLTWTSAGRYLADVGYVARLDITSGTLELRYTEGRGADAQSRTCRIWLEATLPHFGGLSWWMRCPCTGRRARKLYKFPGVDLFCHRTAIRPLPTYESQRASGIGRLLERRWAIRRKLGVGGDLTEPLERPRGMHRRTFARWAALDERLEAMDRSLLDQLSML